MKISKKDRKTLILGGGAIAVILIVVYFVLPAYDSMGQVASELDQKERMLSQTVKALGSRSLYQDENKILDEELGRLKSQLLDSSDPAIAQNQLENIVRSIAEQHQVVISRSTPLQEKKTGEKYSKVTVQINLQIDRQNGMSDLASFMHAISTHAKFLTVEEFYVNGFKVRDEIRLQPRMNISGFIQLNPAENQES